jgi:hypothetical protein
MLFFKYKTVKYAVTGMVMLLACLCSFAQSQPHTRLSHHQQDSLQSELETMLAKDQQYRWMLMYGELNPQKLEEWKHKDEKAKWQRFKDVQKNNAGISQFQKDSIGKYQDENDSGNIVKLTEIITRYGFPTYIEDYKVTTILLHASSAQVNDDYLKMLKEEVLLGNMSAMEYARLYDEVHYRLHLPELYYVNETFDQATGKGKVAQPVNMDETNKARKEIGLKKFKAQN